MSKYNVGGRVQIRDGRRRDVPIWGTITAVRRTLFDVQRDGWTSVDTFRIENGYQRGPQLGWGVWVVTEQEVEEESRMILLRARLEKTGTFELRPSPALTVDQIERVVNLIEDLQSGETT